MDSTGAAFGATGNQYKAARATTASHCIIYPTVFEIYSSNATNIELMHQIAVIYKGTYKKAARGDG